MSDDRMGSARRGWAIQAAIAAIAIYLYVFTEWLFFVTKPSFMTDLGVLQKLQVLLVAPLPLLAAGAVALLVLWAPAFAARNRIARCISEMAGSFLAAAVLAAMFFLLVDNFTFTVMHFGVRSIADAARYVYAVLFLILIAFSYQIVNELRVKCSRSAAWRATALAAAALVLVSASATVVTHIASRSNAPLSDIHVVQLKNRPNVILISGDGLNARSMSIYGYNRATTPFLEEMADKMLLCENCFANADASLGSIASMLTGKLPTQTRVCYPPEILEGRNAYEHLPGILHKYGYRNIDVGMRHYADPIEMNMKDAFEYSSFRRVGKSRVSKFIESLSGENPFFFVRTMGDRISDRVLHAFGLRRMENPMAEVTGAGARYIKDAKRVDAMFSFIDEEPSAPFFAHLHLMGTHGPIFFPEKNVFSVKHRAKVPWSVDSYNDVILDLDRRLRHIVEGLQMRGILSNTVIVVCSDHAQRYAVGSRIPLVFLFPGEEHRGRIEANVQNLDIAPTILDYLGI
ncbi:MAG: sulfatase-like hydrolase/transferase, partial [Candidatus Krumholzibacteria bacterium]|nr:sulfatase-like hydrolase/transferase [Candidatus Krumholzibacteria bacterium]